MNRSKAPLTLAISLASASFSAASFSQSLTLEEVIVTAQKREQSLQDVPIAVTALSRDFLQQTGTVTLSDVANVTPGLNISNTQSEDSSITMRGVGSNDFGYSSDESIPVYLDGVYMGNGASIVGDLMDVSQVEVLKGPQGTLFGRNAVGGAVSVTTTNPSNELEGTVKLGAGNYGLRTVQGMVNLPLIDDELALRISSSTRDRDGWQKNVATGLRDGYEQDRWNSRIKLLWTPSDNLELEFSSDWQREQDHAGYYNIIDSPFAEILSQATLNTTDTLANNGSGFFDGFSIDGPDGNSVDHRLKRKIRGNALKVTWNISEDLTLTSTSSYRELRSAISEDNDGTEYLILNVRSFLDNEEYSQEFRLSGVGESIDWFVGLSAYRSDVGGRVDDGFGALFIGEAFEETAIVKAKTESYALFGDAIWAFSDNTNVTFGLRASYDAKSQDINNPSPVGLLFAGSAQLIGADGNPDPSLARGHENWSDVSPRLVVDHQLNEDFMIYGGISQGYKSGGFNSFPVVDLSGETLIPGTAIPAVPFGSTAPFDEEKITNYEFGFKSTLMDGRLRLNSSLFYYDFKDLQFLVSNGVTTSAQNAGKAEGKGLDLDAVFLISENLTLSTNMGWLSSEYGEDVIDANGVVIVQNGQELAYAPHFSGNIGIDYTLELSDLGELRAHINYAYTGDRSHNGENASSIYREESSGLLSARLSLRSSEGQWELAMWGNNLTNEDTIESYGGVTNDFGFVSVRRGEPRMYGLELSYSY